MTFIIDKKILMKILADKEKDIFSIIIQQLPDISYLINQLVKAF